ncbi:Clavaminate synthase-like protein [Epithele typhae]|uniref:Clavaminate synthase-like protein n=1 Tax=Epithele typhae TaxID=378194 RepID=UPI00200802D2|nr:Clavaminate synthase-like protein [Epithele typhae]KAH9946099.1 Clavaminate synthase-like protein [Epithele typhae]
MEPRCARQETVLSYQEFLDNYLLPNIPVILGPALVQDWSAIRKWRRDGTIDWDHLSAVYGDSEVTVANCSTRDFSDQQRELMLFRDVVSLWQSGAGEDLYVKDWHLARQLAAPSGPALAPELSSRAQGSSEPFYTTPAIFRDDWMNAYYAAHTADDFRFVYAGPAGTFTPLHRDVYASYSWSTNVAGRKRWWLFPPVQTPLLFRKGREAHAEVAFDVRDVDPEEFPGFKHARPVIVEQGPGETIFVPSGWHHQVENLTNCLSINHNWCNSVNLPTLYRAMCAKVDEVEQALEDVRELLLRTSADAEAGADSIGAIAGWRREWTTIVQDVVEKDAGWHWTTFWKMVRHALSLEVGRPCPVREDLWPVTPDVLTPPIEFIRMRIQACADDFLKREQREVDHVAGLSEVLSDIQDMLRAPQE